MTVREALAQVERERAEILQQLRYVWLLASRLGPKAHNTHREEALALLDGTLRDAEVVLKKYWPKS